MQIYRGKSVFGGITIGRIFVYDKEEKQVKRKSTKDREGEIKRCREAVRTAEEQLAGLYEKALQEVGEAGAAIFEIHRMLLQDRDYQDSIENIIYTQWVNAEFAVARTADNFSEMFSAMKDDYMRGLDAELRDISDLLLAVLQDE